MGTQFGMTHFVNPSNNGGDLVTHLVELTGGGMQIILLMRLVI